MTVSLVSEGVIEVSAREKGKLDYLFASIVAYDEVYRDFKAWRQDVAFGHGITVDARIDWRSVANYCAPHVLVMLTHDKTGSEFEDFPLYAVLPESGHTLRLESVESITVTVSDDTKVEVAALGALQALDTYILSLDSGKKENAVKQLRILQRILR